MRIWYTKQVETEYSDKAPIGGVRTEFGNRIVDLHMGYDWYLGQGHAPITAENIEETHNIVVNWMLDVDDLEVVFTNFQGKFMTDELYNHIREMELSHTSMSVGDIIETCDGVLHFVDSLGFVTLGSK